MACTKQQLVEAINSYATARATGDGNLINLAAGPLQQFIDTLEFEPEPVVEAAETEVVSE